MEITSARFIISNTNPDKCPPPIMPEYAFIGRSNVGKSALINMLTQQKKLAKTSVKPGKTRLINHFLINDKWYLVDLPGYGYAKVSKSERTKWMKYIQNYLTERKNLVCLFVLIDIRHEPQKIDNEFMEWLAVKNIPFSILFTKADKISKTKQAKNIKIYKSQMLKVWEEMPKFIITSSVQNTGKDELLEYIEQLHQFFK